MANVYLNCEVSHGLRWSTFAAGLALNAGALLLLILAAPHFVKIVEVNAVASSRYTPLISPFRASANPPTVMPRSAPRELKIARLETPKLEAPREVAPHIASPRPSTENPKVKTPEPEATFPAVSVSNSVPKTTPREIKTDVFAAAEKQTAVSHSARQVQTGGFGDPNGISGKGDPKRNTLTVASVGSFALPPGGGSGNGAAGTRGASGTIRNAGFGTLTSSPHPSSGGSVTASGFGDVVASAPATKAAQSPKARDLQPVEIVFKPRPTYTEEALRRRIEGEVLLEVVFGASGSLRINRVVRGLGYGLDDSALAAAQHIRFRPARRDGQPYDCAALVHIVFELSK